MEPDNQSRRSSGDRSRQSLGRLPGRAAIAAALVLSTASAVVHVPVATAQEAARVAPGDISGLIRAVADATATGGILIPAMKKEGYKPGYAAAVIAAGAMLGPILPPSIPLIIYAIMANLSIGKLFLAGVVPGLLLFAGYMVICAWVARREGYAAKEPATWMERVQATRGSIWALLVPVLLVSGSVVVVVEGAVASAAEGAGGAGSAGSSVGGSVISDMRYW